jgi:hypothetical protein
MGVLHGLLVQVLPNTGLDRVDIRESEPVIRIYQVLIISHLDSRTIHWIYSDANLAARIQAHSTRQVPWQL